MLPAELPLNNLQTGKRSVCVFSLALTCTLLQPLSILASADIRSFGGGAVMYKYRCRATPTNETRLGNRPSVIYTEQLSQGGAYLCMIRMHRVSVFSSEEMCGKCRAAAAVAFGAWLGGRMRNAAMQALRSEAGVKRLSTLTYVTPLFYSIACNLYITKGACEGNKWCVIQLP